MPKAQLRVYYGPEKEAAVTELADECRRTVDVPVGQVFGVLADAIRSQRSWLRDFEDDMITISEDLYEVLLAYERFRRPPA